MCRFLLVKSKQLINPKKIVGSFAEMAQKSRAFDGDAQCDGWGISWLKNDVWQNYKSVNPIWEEKKTFTQFPESSIFAMHARSASFPQHKNNIEYNQPYINGEYSYVFNGLLKGVTLSLSGDIGAQKIWNLLNIYLKDLSLNESLIKMGETLKKNSRLIQALNVGIAHRDSIAAYSQFTEHPAYYSLHYVDSPSVKIICSEPIDGFDFKSLANNSSLLL